MDTLEKTMSQEDKDRYAEYFSELAKEDMRIRVVKNDIYVTGSVLGCYTLAYEHRDDDIEVGYGAPITGGWYMLLKDQHIKKQVYATARLETILDSALNHEVVIFTAQEKGALIQKLESCLSIANELETYPF
jgi:hypothetical protein